MCEICNSTVQVYVLEADLMGRTVQFKNMDDQLVAIAAKSTKALIMSQVCPSFLRL
jgi:sulfur transfer complex TusBCD TusB component (DsrH family)